MHAVLSMPMAMRSALALACGRGQDPSLSPTHGYAAGCAAAQTAAWIDKQHYAIGRWDGSLCLFNASQGSSAAPVVNKLISSPEHEGVQMIVPLGGGPFITSSDDRSVLVWRAPKDEWSKLAVANILRFDPALGVANSGAAVVLGAGLFLYLVLGHANGYLSIWQAQGLDTWSLQATVDLRSRQPVNPWKAHNIRAIAALEVVGDYGFVIAGSEDGDLNVIRVPDGRIINTVVYNPEATRGTSGLAVAGRVLLVANGAAGASDANLWSYAITPRAWTIENKARARLTIDPDAPQVFNFDVAASRQAGGAVAFLSVTQDGALWRGRVNPGGDLTIFGHQIVGPESLGAALCLQEDQLAVALEGPPVVQKVPTEI